AAPAQPLCRLEPMPAGVGERAQDERALEFAQETIADTLFAARERLCKLAVERGVPIDLAGAAARRGRGGLAHLGGQVGDIDPLARRHHGDPMAQVLELPYVSWKREGCEQLQR